MATQYDRRRARARKAPISNSLIERTGARLAALGGSVKGVDGTDGYTRKEARLVKRARRRQKGRRLMKRFVASNGGDTSGY